MHKAYNDYYWKNGKPYGRNLTSSPSEITYRVVVDPYYTRYSVEEYKGSRFHRLIYDSALFDFRHLRRPEHATWQKETLNERTSFIRNHDDRVILKEVYEFEENLCRTCHLFSPHDIPLSTHHLFYHALGDPFNGVILYDINHKPILKKTYACHSTTHDFTELLSESWEVILPASS